MAVCQVDNNGKKIKTDILTAGYLRQHIENQYRLSIPSVIKLLCFMYWFLNAYDLKNIHKKLRKIIEDKLR